MSTTKHTPYQDGTTKFRADHMNVPLGELNDAIDQNETDLDAVESEVSTARGGEASLDARLDGMESDIAALGDVTGPATNTADYIPQWDGPDSKTLKEGLAVVTTVGSPGADTNLPTEQAVREAITASGGGDVVGPASNTDDYVPQWTGVDSKTLKDGFQITTAGKALIDDADAAAQRTTLGLGSIATLDVWTGTGAEYTALGTYDSNTIYLLTTAV